MATLVLTTVGTLVGGPIGGAIGAVIGQSVDQRLFAPKARHGPRLGDLSVQTSSYGSQLPKIFGTFRAAGTVIWATDLVETRSSNGGGKGRPKTGYSYSANFAVALSSRQVRAVRRIWADGKLLRGADGDFKTRLGAFRLHSGDEDQDVDPLIAAEEGPGLAPAYRGLAYAVFEGLQLEDYGNRIPSLSFEIEADNGPVPIGTIAQELSGGTIAGGETPSLFGYAASGDSVRGAVQPLADLASLILVDGGEGTFLSGPSAEPVTLERRAATREAEIARRAAGSVAGEVTLTHYEPARDHQSGLQRAFRDGPHGRSETLGVAAAFDADQAKSFAEGRLSSLWAARSSAKVRLAWRHMTLKPGAVVTLEAAPGLWLVDRWMLGPMTVDLDLRRLPDHAALAMPASPGRPMAELDRVHGPTVLRLLDLPMSGGAQGASLFALAAGASPGWRRALLTASFDGGASWSDIGATAEPAIIGTASGILAAAPSTLIDDVNVLEVDLLHAGMWLEGRSDAALAAGDNLAVVGSELVQFGRADHLGGGTWRLSRFLRGRRGTEWASQGHQAGETFALLDAASVLPVAVPPGTEGAEATLVAVGIGDPSAGVVASCQVSNEALRPPSPVHLGASRNPDGDLVIRWVRRSRAGWTWTSGADTPLGEEQERYRLTVESADATRTFDLAAATLTYGAAEQAADGIAGPVSISVVQVGTHSSSRPARIALG